MRKKRLHLQIALVGAQPTPVYQGIVHMQPDQIVLVCSKQTQTVADSIRKQLPSYQDKDIMTFCMSDTDVEQMYVIAERVEQALPKGISISLNVTGGMKLWSVIFHQVFRSKRRSCHTFCIGQDGSFFDLKSRKTMGKVEFDMDAQFKILNHNLDKYTSFSDYTHEDLAEMNKIMQIVSNEKRRYNLAMITSAFYEGYKKTYNNLLFDKSYLAEEKYNELGWDPDTHTFECKLGYHTYTFSSPNIEKVLLNTGWFELYVAHLIAQTYGKENIRLNCIFLNHKNLPKNEIDIIVNTGSKLIFVECKTQIFNSTDVDKFRSAVRNYGGLGSKPLFVTLSKMKPEAEEKCNDHKITTFYLDNQEYRSSQDRIYALSNILDKLNGEWNI